MYDIQFYIYEQLLLQSANACIVKLSAKYLHLEILSGKVITLFLKPVFKWLGGSDIAREGYFVWNSSGNPLNYTLWNPGAPNGLTSENCMLMHARYGRWDDYFCTDRGIATFCEVIFQCTTATTTTTTTTTPTPTTTVTTITTTIPKGMIFVCF